MMGDRDFGNSGTRYFAGFCATITLVFGGCAPTPTSATTGLPRQQLAVLEVPRHNDVVIAVAAAREPVHIGAICIDGDLYPIHGDRSFLLTTGAHHIDIRYEKCAHGPATWFDPFAGFMFAPPTDSVDFTVSAGHRYQLWGYTRGAGSLLSFGHDVKELNTLAGVSSASASEVR